MAGDNSRGIEMLRWAVGVMVIVVLGLIGWLFYMNSIIYGIKPQGSSSVDVELADLRTRVESLETKLIEKSTPFPEGLTIGTITSPADGEVVPSYMVDVEMTISAIKEGEFLWLFVHPHGTGGYWPQVGRVETAGGPWSQLAYLGIKDNRNDVGRKFDILLGKADETADKAISDYLMRGKATGDYPEEALPSGVKILDRVTVTRTK